MATKLRDWARDDTDGSFYDPNDLNRRLTSATYHAGLKSLNMPPQTGLGRSTANYSVLGGNAYQAKDGSWKTKDLIGADSTASTYDFANFTDYKIANPTSTVTQTDWDKGKAGSGTDWLGVAGLAASGISDLANYGLEKKRIGLMKDQLVLDRDRLNVTKADVGFQADTTGLNSGGNIAGLGSTRRSRVSSAMTNAF